jgi:hypothetical protein
MLKIDLQGEKLASHHDAVEAYFNIYLHDLTDEFKGQYFTLRTSSDKHQATLIEANFKATPFAGSPVCAESCASNVNTAIEICFARARRTIIRQHRLAALAS